MCGIFGWIPSKNYQQTDLKYVLEKVFKAISHRGPDDRGYAVWDSTDSVCFDEKSTLPNSFRAMIGQVRLSIIDLSPLGHQPMFTDDGRYSIVYNGEVFNYIELRRELESEGVKFSTPGDSEVVMQAVIHWQEKALTRFTGMFAFVLFDKKENTLFCARDFFGIKPFYWHNSKMGFCFASEIPALLEFPDVPRNISANSAYKYLCFGVSTDGDSCMLSDIYQLPPAHYMKVQLSKIELTVPVRYWKPDISVRSKLSFDDAAARLRELFLNSVSLHLRSDVPVGVALSGGIDSSAVTCAVRYLKPQADLHTFSYIAKGSAVSEEYYANLIAEHTGAIKHTVEVSSKELIRDLDSMIYHLGEPFGSTSIYAQYRVFKLAGEQGIKVTLDGQGADELLAGYFGYQEYRINTLLRSGNIIGAMKFWKSVTGLPRGNNKNIILKSFYSLLPAFIKSSIRKTIRPKQSFPAWIDINALINDGAQTDNSINNSMDELYPSSNKLKQILAWHLTSSGLPALLRHGDRNAMAHSIESRVPFLTKDIAEFCLSLPEEYLVDMNGTSKSVFRAAMRGIVPDEILDRKDKIGFETPEQDWFNSIAPWIEETLSFAKNIPYLKIDAAKKEWQNVQKGSAKFDWRIWRWINYIRWVGMFKVK